MAMGQNLRYLFGDDYPSKVVYFKGFWDVHRGTHSVLTHSHVLSKGALDPQVFDKSTLDALKCRGPEATSRCLAF